MEFFRISFHFQYFSFFSKSRKLFTDSHQYMGLLIFRHYFWTEFLFKKRKYKGAIKNHK